MVDFAALLIVTVFVVGVLWFFRRSGAKTSEGSRDRGRQPKPSEVAARPASFHWPGSGDFEFEVVGESFYQEDLARLVGEHGDQSANFGCIATLILDDENVHDSKAVAVFIGDKKVAHLSKEDARSFRRRLGAKKLTGETTACDAIIVGGGTRQNGEKLMYGVKLDLKPFH